MGSGLIGSRAARKRVDKEFEEFLTDSEVW